MATRQPIAPEEVQEKEVQNKIPGKEETVEEMSPKEKRKADVYTSALLKLIHAPETSGHIFSMLKSAPPETSVPKTALTVNMKMEEELKSKKDTRPSLETLLLGGVALVSDLIEIGNAGDAWGEDVGQEQGAQILQDTMQQYIEKGLKDGTIDPVELQAKVEPLMSEEHRQAGMQGAEMTGIPQEANENTAMEKYATEREQKVRKSMMQKEAGGAI